MKNIFYILLFLFSIFYSINNSFAIKYSYPYVCENQDCYNTKLEGLNPNKNGYYLGNEKIDTISNFNSLLISKLNNIYNNIYKNKKIILLIKNTNGEYINKDFTLKDLIDYEKEIIIGEIIEKEVCSGGFLGLGKNCDIEKIFQEKENYNDGLDYIFSNYKNLIDKLHIGLPIGLKDNKISSIHKNILLYNNGKISLKNICDNAKCLKSEIKNIHYLSNNSVIYIDGIINTNNNFNSNIFKISENSSISQNIKAGDTLDFKFGFEDYLDISKSNTKYIFEIGFINNTTNEEETFFTGSINIDNSNFNFDSPGLNLATSQSGVFLNISDVIELNVLDENLKHIEVMISQKPVMLSAGNIQFYMNVKNLNTNREIEDNRITNPRKVSPSDNLGTDSKMEFTDYFLNKYLNKNTTLRINLELKDEYGNNHFDNIDGYNIELLPGSSQYIEIGYSKDGKPPLYGKEIKNYRLRSGEKITFLMRITEGGYHSFNGFNIKFKEKEHDSKYITPIINKNIKIYPPYSMYSNGALQKIYVNLPSQSEDFNFTCTKGPIYISTKCLSDNYSGCNSGKNGSRVFNSESQNGTERILIVQDYAYNTVNYKGIMNHIDQTSPTITLFKNGINLDNPEYTFKANDDSLKIKFYEKTTSNCSSRIDYLIKLNGKIVYNSFHNGSDLELLYDKLLKTSGINQKLYIKATDKYGNFRELTKTFNIYPADLDENKTTISVNSNGNIYANNSDYYEYTLNLKDKYNNPIYQKNLTYLNQEKGSITGDFKTITTNMLDNTGEDSIIEYYTSLTSDSNGEIKFKVKSYSPGEFTQRFLLKIKNWGNDYVDNNTETSIIKGINGNNEFKKPVIGKIEVIEGGNIPELRKKQKYEISLLNDGNLSGYSSGNINISHSTIVSDIEGHFWNTFDNINGVFNNNLSNNLTFLGELDANNNILKTPIIKNDNLEISYNLGGKNIKYYLDNFQTEATCDLETLGVKVYGILQGDGKSDITGQEENFSDLSKSSLRGNIRKNAYELIKNRTSNTIINNVKYIEGDYTISGEQNYETLILKDGNLIINGDLNNSGKKLGIIILRDNFNILTDYNKGNIYVTNNVEKIDAIIYSDGAFRSLKEDGNEYLDSDLNKKLELYGSLFTRNTIGGAVRGGTNYTLPGGQITTNYELAEIYDLNYIRKVNNTCSGNPEDNYSFIIKYNPNVQSNPPKGFSNN